MNRLTIEERRRIYLAQQRTRHCEPDPIPKLSGPSPRPRTGEGSGGGPAAHAVTPGRDEDVMGRSEEHTSELQSRPHLVCRLLLEKKNIAGGAGKVLVKSSYIVVDS